MKISIITTTYNSAATLRDTINSVLSQSYPNIEYIIKDAGSTDDTLKICREYEPRFNGRMKIISCPDKGIYDGMNQGIQAATGDVIGILNSDDLYSDSERVKAIMGFFTKDPHLEAITANTRVVKQDLSKTVRYVRSAYFQRWMTHIGYVPSHPSFYVKRACYEKWGLYNTDYRIVADSELMARFFYIHKIVYRYVNMEIVTMRIGGTSMKSKSDNTKELLSALNNLGIYTNRFLLSFRYILKLPELVLK